MANEKQGEPKKGRDKHYRVIDGQLYARVVYRDEFGRRRERHYPAESKTHARELYKEKLQELTTHGERMLDADRMSFSELASEYEKHKLIPAEYQGERKTAGLRSLDTPKMFLKTLVNYFGSKRIRNITHADIEKFKRERLKAPVVIKYKDPETGKEKTRERPRSIASVNRELEILRAALRFAVQQGWLIRSPFEAGAPLISKADETRRERILSREEETKLLDACLLYNRNNRQSRAHLRPVIIAALDTGCRRGELFQLKWSDVDLDSRTINVRSATTKTQRARSVPISARLLAELTVLRQAAKSEDSLVFGVTTDVKHAFASACKDAGISGFRFHDCRATFVTRLLQRGMPMAEVMRLSGHSTLAAMNHYVRVDGSTVERAASLLDDFHAAVQEEAEAESKLIN
jgi:integrase